MGMSTGSDGAMSEINVTPLVDVMLVLLIVFMVATPMITRERAERELEENRDQQQRLVSLNLPVLAENSTPKIEEDSQTVTLGVSSALKVSIGAQEVADCSAHKDAVDKEVWLPCLQEVQAALLADEGAKAFGVTVDAAPDIPFGFVVGVLHRLHLAEVKKVGMLPRR